MWGRMGNNNNHFFGHICDLIRVIRGNPTEENILISAVLVPATPQRMKSLDVTVGRKKRPGLTGRQSINPRPAAPVITPTTSPGSEMVLKLTNTFALCVPLRNDFQWKVLLNITVTKSQHPMKDDLCYFQPAPQDQPGRSIDMMLKHSQQSHTAHAELCCRLFHWWIASIFFFLSKHNSKSTERIRCVLVYVSLERSKVSGTY